MRLCKVVCVYERKREREDREREKEKRERESKYKEGQTKVLFLLNCLINRRLYLNPFI